MPQNRIVSPPASAHGATGARRRPTPIVKSSAPTAGHTATQLMHDVHSAERIDASVATGRPAGHAVVHFPQSMQASVVLVIRVGLTSATRPIIAPYGHR